MVRIILPSRTLEAYWAGVSVATGRFNALLPLSEDSDALVRDFSGLERFRVEETGVAPVEYEGFTVFDSLTTRDDGKQIRLRKEAVT